MSVLRHAPTLGGWAAAARALTLVGCIACTERSATTSRRAPDAAVAQVAPTPSLSASAPGPSSASATQTSASTDASDDRSTPAPHDPLLDYVVRDAAAAEPNEAWPDRVDVEALLALVPLQVRDAPSLEAARALLGSGIAHGNQGNPAISEHAISRAQCLRGLQGVILQSAEQRAICGGELEVPVYTGTDPRSARACIDVFEYPNKPCELPFVFVKPIDAMALCKLAGKRLCWQSEWEQACEANPDGPPSPYSYGPKLDLSACITGKAKSPDCDVDHALWKTCGTHTEPSGSAPRCRSPLGVFDLHGNVAEVMVRPADPTEPRSVRFVQMKGSAFFYDGKVYPDHCRYNPRWHVAPVQESWHVNYHLGFRCCRTVVEPAAPSGQ